MAKLTGNPIAASQLLRHQNYSVTLQHYVKTDRAELAEGMRLVETSLARED